MMEKLNSEDGQLFIKVGPSPRAKSVIGSQQS